MKRALLSALVAIASFFLAASLLADISPLPLSASTPELLTQAVQHLVRAIGSAVALWYLFTALAVLLRDSLRLLGSSTVRLDRAIGRLGAPLLRRLATWTAISTLTLASPAVATAAGAPVDDPSEASHATDTRNATFLVDLGWVVTPDANEEAFTAPEAGPNPPRDEDPDPEPRSPHPEHLVRPGETLWGIAEAHLEGQSAHVEANDIAEHWPRWYAENLHTIGSDPDLITPGMRLHAPPLEES